MAQENNNRKKLFSILGLLAVIVCIGGISFAFFNYIRTGSSNIIKVGRIAFNSETTSITLTNFTPISSEEALTDTDNAGTITVRITGDTEYDNGVEYLVSVSDIHNTVNDKTIPISVIVSYTESENKDIGTPDDVYFANRGGNSSIYKILAGDKVETAGPLLVGYIAKGNTGIDGVVSITAYVNEDDIMVSDTFTGETEKVVLTTTEWSSLKGNNALSFKIKVEANAGVWVENTTNSYAIKFLSEGGSAVSGIQVPQRDIIGEFPPKPTRSGYSFKGWYTAATDGEEVTELTQVTSNMTLHAQWDKLVCMKATARHTEKCEQTSTSNGCRKAGYATNAELTYGELPGDRSPSAGYAYDCDINNDGNYIPTDPEAVSPETTKYTERFYFINRNSTTKRASLVYYTSYDEFGRVNSQHRTQPAQGGGSYTYDLALTHLPYNDNDSTTTTDWSNPYLTNFDGKTARLLTINDIEALCGPKTSDNNYLYNAEHKDTCQVLFENSRFQSSSHGRAGIWLAVEASKYDRIHTQTAILETKNASSENTVRPVIEIPARLIEGYKETYHVTFNSQGGSSVSGRDVLEGDTLGTLPTEPLRRNYTFDGWYTTPSYTKEVTSATVIESDRTFYAKWIVSGTTIDVVTLNVGDGTIENNELYFAHNTAVGEIPSPTPASGYVFDGWYDQSLTTRYTEETIITEDITFYAKYAADTKYAEMNGTYYDTVQLAIDAAPTTKTTVRLLQDATYSTAIDMSSKNTDKDIVLDLNNHIINISGTGSINAFKLKASLELKNGTIKTGAGSGAIDLENSNAVLVMNSGKIEATGTRQAIYNNGGTVRIGGTAELSASAQVQDDNKRGTVHNLAGTLEITGGKITSTYGTTGIAVSIVGGTATIGTKDDKYNINNILIRGYGNGIYSTQNYNLYDGLVEGGNAAVNDTSKITTEDDAVANDPSETETVNSKTYYKLYYTLTEEYTINLVTYGGTVSPNSRQVTVGDTLVTSTITNPTWTNKTFSGWYLDEDLTEAAPNVIAPLQAGSMTLYAKWTYTPASSLVNYDVTNAAMTTYYNNINTWKDLSQSDFATQMSTNFNNNNCSACEGANACNSPGAGTYCDKPKTYDTGTNSALNVYLYDETTHVIGKKIEYANATSGTLSNLIPGQAYYWEKASDPSVNGHVQVSTPRRNVDAGNIRNVRDLGGMSISYTENSTQKTGTLKYGKLFRGAKLSSSNADITSLTNLGITREIDLRADSEGSGQVRLPVLDNGSGGSDIIITNYLINPTATTYITSAHLSDYRNLKAAMKTVMRYIVAGDNIYFHCTIGTDRTGTIAYFLEGLLGVSEEDRLEDYELSYFFGITNRTRYHDNLSGSSINPRFYSMYRSYPTNQDIYNFYKYEPESDDDTLLAAFRAAMIDYNS